MERLLLSVMLASLLCAAPAVGADPMDWLNAVRAAAHRGAAAPDPLLDLTAQRWAARLASAGVLTHRGDDGSGVLDRYRAAGGTEIHVGEILGAGPSEKAVEAAWMKSVEHREIALSPDWTHAGWGVARSGASVVMAMVFTRRLVEELHIAADKNGLTVSGRFTVASAGGAVLYNGLRPVAPSAWQARDRSFVFELPAGEVEGYLRLGYRGPDGGSVLTNALTWPPETESPEASSRFEAPAPSP